MRAGITALLDHAEQSGCGAVVTENLDVADALATGRDTLGRGRPGKTFRRTVAGLPTRRFRTRLTAMAHRRGIAVIGVDAAYTSKWGTQHWRNPWQQQTSDPVTRHHAAAAAIGRRGLGFGDQATAGRIRTGLGHLPLAGDGPLRAHHRPGPTTSPARLAGTAVPAHRPAHHEADRSTGKHPPTAANTVRAAPEQNSLLLTNQERLPVGDARPLLHVANG